MRHEKIKVSKAEQKERRHEKSNKARGPERKHEKSKGSKEEQKGDMRRVIRQKEGFRTNITLYIKTILISHSTFP